MGGFGGKPQLDRIPSVTRAAIIAKQNPEKLLGKWSSTKSSEDVVGSVAEGRLLDRYCDMYVLAFACRSSDRLLVTLLCPMRINNARRI